MTLIRPSNLFVGDDTPQSEIDVYNLFSKKLSDDTYVICNVNWYKRTFKSEFIPKEIDFIVAIPNEGLLFLEVKGGQKIRYDEKEKQWYSQRSDTEEEFKIDNPVKQASDAMYHFKEILSKIPAWKKNLRIRGYFWSSSFTTSIWTLAWISACKLIFAS